MTVTIPKFQDWLSRHSYAASWTTLFVAMLILYVVVVKM